MDGPPLSNSLLTVSRVVLIRSLGPQAPTMTRSSKLPLPVAAAAIKLPIFGRPENIRLNEEEILSVDCCSTPFSGSFVEKTREGSAGTTPSFTDTFSDKESGDVGDDAPDRSVWRVT